MLAKIFNSSSSNELLSYSKIPQSLCLSIALFGFDSKQFIFTKLLNYVIVQSYQGHTWSVPNILGPGPGPGLWLARISVQYQDQDCVCFNSQDRDCPGPGLGLVSSPVARTSTSPRPGPRHRYWPGLSSNQPRTKTLSRGTGNRVFSIDVASTIARYQLIYLIWEWISIYV